MDLAAVILALVEGLLKAKALKSGLFEPPEVEAAARLPRQDESARVSQAQSSSTHDVEALVEPLETGRVGTAEVLEAEPARDPAGPALVEAVALLEATFAPLAATVRLALTAALAALTTSRRAAMQRAFAPDSFHQSNCSSEASLMLQITRAQSS